METGRRRALQDLLHLTVTYEAQAALDGAAAGARFSITGDVAGGVNEDNSLATARDQNAFRGRLP